MRNAVTRAAQYRVYNFRVAITGTLTRLVEQFEDMVSRETSDPSEIPVQAAIKHFVAVHRPTIRGDQKRL